MKNRRHFRSIITLAGLVAALIIFITPGFSQDTLSGKTNKKVKIIARVVRDDNGNRQEFDTTINLDRTMKPGEEDEVMRQLELRFSDLGDQMKELESDMIEINIPDSGMMDSIQTMTEKAMKSGAVSRNNFHFRHSNTPRPFNYSYDFRYPGAPEPDNGMQHARIRRIIKDHDQSLNDLLGDIPLSRVKSYSIKDTKGGKKIVIELNNEAITK